MTCAFWLFWVSRRSQKFKSKCNIAATKFYPQSVGYFYDSVSGWRPDSANCSFEHSVVTLKDIVFPKKYFTYNEQVIFRKAFSNYNFPSIFFTNSYQNVNMRIKSHKWHRYRLVQQVLIVKMVKTLLRRTSAQKSYSTFSGMIMTFFYSLCTAIRAV